MADRLPSASSTSGFPGCVPYRILSTPVYYFNMTAQMKAFVDRNYFLLRHGISIKARCAAFIVVAGSFGLKDTIKTLTRFINFTSKVPEDNIFTLSSIARKPEDAKNDPVTIQTVHDLLVFCSGE